AAAPVEAAPPFVFDLPEDAAGAAILEGSSPQATVNGRHVAVQGAFAPGSTLVQVAFELPASSGSLDFSQRFPAPLDQIGLIVSKVDSRALRSPQSTRQAEMPADGQTYIAGTGGAVAAGQPMTLTLDGLPHESTAPRWTALTLAVLIIVAGGVAVTRPQDRA